MPIHLLDEDLINKIAAGEVIERPGSIVKELVENSIDAHSSHIAVKIVDGGLESIEVEDNGCGIAPEDIPRAFMRHATSKISTEEDLYNISTMGFRGEALPSIASISQIEMFTAAGENQGRRAVIKGGNMVLNEPYPCPPGTKIKVSHIFYNTPARKKFQKSAVSENMHIYDTMLRLALSHPGISFKFSSDRKTYFKTPGNGKLRDAVLSIYGQEFLNNLIPVEYQGENYSLTGLISRPEYKRLNRKNQIFYVNNRFIKSQLLARAVDEAYRGFLVSREYPAVLLFIKVRQDEIDVNVHPQKLEVRFRDEKGIFKLVSRVLRESLNPLSYSWGGCGADHSSGTVDSGLKGGSAWGQDSIIQESSPVRYYRYKDTPEISEGNYERPFTPLQSRDETGKPDVSLPGDFIIIGQLFSSYILVEREDKFWLVDQHAAHERINYNNFREYNKSRNQQVQSLLIPLALEVSEDMIDILEKNRPIIEKMGFAIDKLGYASIVVRGIPVYIKGKEEETIRALLDVLAEQQKPDLEEKILMMMACKQAIKAGDPLSNREMYKLVQDLLNTEDYWHCPHGRPTIIEINNEELNRKFKR